MSRSTPSVAARLDRLPATRSLWGLVAVLSLGGTFEYYDLFLTGYVVPGMAKAGVFSAASLGPLSRLPGAGANGAGTFVFMTFAGLFAGALLFGRLADRFGRRAVFTWSMVWYSAATFAMVLGRTGLTIELWRFVAGMGLGVELVTLDTYLAELVPPAARGRAFALNQVMSFLAVPLAALLAWVLVPAAPFGVEGWRWVVLLGSAGALAVWLIRRRVPDSPRWLDRQGRAADAERVTLWLEDRARADTGSELPEPGEAAPASHPGAAAGWAVLARPPYRGRVVLMTSFQVCQTIGFYGFAAWVPSLLVAKGVHATTSLLYAFVIAVANPLGPLVGVAVADRVERKWQIVGSALAVAAFGILFARQTEALPLIGLGVGVTLGINWMSFAFHGYQAELFPTRVRSRAVGFVYAWSRLSAAFAGLLIASLLATGGVGAVFTLIAGAMAVVVLSIGLFGPRTLGRPLEEVSP